VTVILSSILLKPKFIQLRYILKHECEKNTSENN
jgi:hypothetical protein